MARRRKLSDAIQCPCCGGQRPVSLDQSPVLDEALLSMRGRTPHSAEAPGWSVSLARQGKLVWACESCLERRRAIRAKSWLQEFWWDAPRFAYFDRSKPCRSCGQTFVFTAVEQKRWYEEFKIPPVAERVDCHPCRAARRKRSLAAIQLASRLDALDPRNAAQLAEIASLYLTVGSSRKAAEFLRRAKNRTDDPTQVAELLERLSRLETK